MLSYTHLNERQTVVAIEYDEPELVNVVPPGWTLVSMLGLMW